MKLLERETVEFNGEVVTFCDYIIYPENNDKEKNLVIATPATDYMTAKTAYSVIKRYIDLQTIYRTKILASVHSFSDIHYLEKFKGIKTAEDIKIYGVVEKITFLGNMNEGGDITKTYINIYCTKA